MTKPSKQKRPAQCACGWSGQIRTDTYNANIKRNTVYTCHHCATIKAGKAGKFSHTPEKRSAHSRALWQRAEFRAKVTIANIATNTTDEYKAKQAERTRLLWQRTTYRETITEQAKIKMNDPETKARISAGLIKKWKDEVYRASVIDNLGRQKISSLQLTLYEYLDDLGVAYEKEGPKTVIGFYSFDCLVKGNKRQILIECQGDYWHSLPKSIRNDRSKFTYINRYFPEYEIMYIWEHEFAVKDRVLDRLKLKLGIELQVIDYSFNDLRTGAVSRVDANAFLAKYHYLTSSKGGTDYGLFLNGDLIAISRFGPLPRQNMTSFGAEAVELSRMCVHPNYHKKNLLSWWLSKLVRNYRTVVSFADTTVGHTGTIYKASNFKLHHQTDPDYWYVDADGYVMHKKTLYNRAVNLKMTEAEFATKYGYVKKWGGPKLCFVYTNR